jgi:heterodisulfide reductase subunit C
MMGMMGEPDDQIFLVLQDEVWKCGKCGKCGNILVNNNKLFPFGF